jgi:two-component system, NarL family, sensor kinase
MDAHQTSIYTAILISSIILGIIILFFIISIIHHQRRSYALYKLSITAEISTLEKERSRMAADLHDELGPVMSAIKFKVGSIDIHSEGDEQTVEKINTDIDGMVQRMREISNDLMPNILLHKGVVSALTDFIENMRRPPGLLIQFAHHEIPALPEFESIHIYRIVLEIIHNTIKHAEATELKIEFKRAGGLLVLQTKDNGRGFDYNTITRETTRLGLHNLLARTEMLSAVFFVETAKAKGTSYIIEIPLTASIKDL